MEDNTPEFTPVERYGDIWLKRDDLYCYAGIRGGKVRTCRQIVEEGLARPAPGLLAAGRRPTALVTAGARHSPQMQIVARVAARMGLRARCHTATGPATPEMVDAEAHGATVIPHRPGYNSVIIARAMLDCQTSGAIHIPFGMEHPQAIVTNSLQVENFYEQQQELEIPEGLLPKRTVIVLGSGMTAAGILWGLRRAAAKETLHKRPPVLGVQIGADPTRRLDRWAPPGWRQDMRIVKSKHAYTAAVAGTVGRVRLDPHYEAKCVEFLEPGDLFWIVGIRADP